MNKLENNKLLSKRDEMLIVKHYRKIKKNLKKIVIDDYKSLTEKDLEIIAEIEFFSYLYNSILENKIKCGEQLDTELENKFLITIFKIISEEKLKNEESYKSHKKESLIKGLTYSLLDRYKFYDYIKKNLISFIKKYENSKNNNRLLRNIKKFYLDLNERSFSLNKSEQKFFYAITEDETLDELKKIKGYNKKIIEEFILKISELKRSFNFS